jgi:D-alanyl-D-alanine carboxypeptidase
MRNLVFPALLVLANVHLLAETTDAHTHEVAPSAPPTALSDSSLVWHVDDGNGGVDDSLHPDVPINPASITKAATSLWALETLGRERRFETGFGWSGRLDPSTGTLHGDLLVVGGDDPDFHVENAYLVAESLNRAGLRTVTGRLLVDGAFWIGWEGGRERRVADASRRAELMAGRLRDAFDPDRWGAGTRQSIEAFRQRRGIGGSVPPRIVVTGGAGDRAGAEPERIIVTHRSNELAKTLKRFNAYSNNDIERLEPLLGSAQDLTEYLKPRLSDGRMRFETLSGLGSNRMTPRQVVELLEQLRAACVKAGLDLNDVLPVVGCDAGTLERFALLAANAPGAVTAKTGTLRDTDGGVAVLAGLARAQDDAFFFVVASPQIGSRLKRARGDQQRWLIERIEARGGAAAKRCGAGIEYSDTGAEVVRVGSN